MFLMDSFNAKNANEVSNSSKNRIQVVDHFISMNEREKTDTWKQEET